MLTRALMADPFYHEESEEDMGERISSAKDLNVYKRAYELAMRVFDVSKSFPSPATAATSLS